MNTVTSARPSSRRPPRRSCEFRPTPLTLLPAPWWSRPGLGYESGGLRFAGHVLAALAGWHGTPLYLYDAARVTENSVRLRAALTTRALPFRIF